MPKITITGDKGLVQSTGLGLVHGSPATISTAVAAAAETATTLTANTLTVVTVGGAAHRLYLPDPSTLDVGTTIMLSHASAFELSVAGKTKKINGVACTDGNGAFTKEVLLGIGNTTCVVVASDEWVVGPVAAAPDA